MPLQKIMFKPGVNRENTRYTTEGGWYDCDKVRFRQGNPEKIGGWNAFSPNKFIGVCRSLWNWITLAFLNLVGVGTNRKFYIISGGVYYDITPIRSTVTLTNPFQAAYSTLNGGISDTATSLTVTSGTNFASAGILRINSEDIRYTNKVGNVLSGLTRGFNSTTAASHANGAGVGSYTVTVTDTDHGALNGDFVTFSGSGITSLGGNITAAVLKNEFQITYVNDNTYTITVSAFSNASDTGNGGTVLAQYQVNTTPDIQVPLVGWGAGGWGTGNWGTNNITQYSLLLWSQNNFGQDLVYGPNGGPIYYWNANIGLTQSQVTISNASPAVVTLSAGASAVLADDTAITLTTTGDLPTGLTVGTTYFVVNYIASSPPTFNLAATRGGAAIDTSSAGSGNHYISPRGIDLATMGDAQTPIIQNYILVSDAFRFVLVFGTNDYYSTAIDPMLIRWSAQEDPFTWEPLATNQAGSLKLSHGSKIVTAVQTRQEIVVFTDSSLYSLQYLGPPFVWQSQLLGDNLSIIGPNASVVASGVVYWMGVDKFYAYDGRVQTLNCDVRRYVFSDFNKFQTEQVFCGTNEGFNEVWWFYCSANSNTVDRYVIYNYLEQIWYYGTMARTAWLDSGLLPYPLAATYNNRIVQHEVGVDDVETGTPVPIEANISSSEFDIGDGHNFGYVWRVLPDLTFTGSQSPGGIYPTPEVTMTLYPLRNSGSGTGYPGSQNVIKGANYVITEEFTGQIYTRVRGRQLIFEISSDKLGTTWQLGAPRIDIRPDGRR